MNAIKLFSLVLALLMTVACEDQLPEPIAVTAVTLDAESLELTEGEVARLNATVSPRNAENKDVIWISSNASIVQVSNGKVTGLKAGTATITVKTDDGGKIATCQVVVLESGVVYYIDEYGVNHGKGTAIGKVIWAPVNCGYHVTDYKYGKLYQWGRKYGQGYSGNLYDLSGAKNGNYSDATVPIIKEGGVSFATGSHKDHSNVFYTGFSVVYGNWAASENYKLWNSGTEANPIKTEYDPCPAGWRVPTCSELDELMLNRSSLMTNDAGQVGCWFSGPVPYSDSATRIFVSAAGCIYPFGEGANHRNQMGKYWSSSTDDDINNIDYGLPFYLSFDDDSAGMPDSLWAYGYSIRCVQE